MSEQFPKSEGTTPETSSLNSSNERKENEHLTPIEVEPAARENLLEMGFSEAHIERIKELMYDLDYDDCKAKVQRFVKEGIVFDPEKRSVIVKKFHDVTENKGQCATLSLLLLDKLSANLEIYNCISEFNKKGTSDEFKVLKNKRDDVVKKWRLSLGDFFSGEKQLDQEDPEVEKLFEEIENLDSLMENFDRKEISIKKCYGRAPTHFVETKDGGGMHVWLEIECLNYDGAQRHYTSIDQVVLDPSFRKIDTSERYIKTDSSYNPTNISFKSSELFKSNALMLKSTTIGISADNKIAYNLRFRFDKSNKPVPVIEALDSLGNTFSFSEANKGNFDFTGSEINENHIEEIQELLAALDPKYYSQGNLDEISRDADLKFNGFSQ